MRVNIYDTAFEIMREISFGTKFAQTPFLEIPHPYFAKLATDITCQDAPQV